MKQTGNITNNTNDRTLKIYKEIHYLVKSIKQYSNF